MLDYSIDQWVFVTHLCPVKDMGAELAPDSVDLDAARLSEESIIQCNFE